MPEVSEIKWVSVKSTLPKTPFPPIHERSAVHTERLILRPLTEDDLDGLRALRTQPEVMCWTIQGRPDASIEETQANLALQLKPERYNWAICIADTGEFIGIGGMVTMKGELGWPELGYMIRKEAWGKGFVPEFIKAFLNMWWALPRVEVQLTVDETTVRGDGEVKNEVALALVRDTNVKSHKVSNKVGLELAKVFEVPDLQDNTKTVTLYGYLTQKTD